MGLVTPLEFAAYLAAARAAGVDEFSLGDMAVKFARAPGPVVEEHDKAEPAAPPTALDMVSRSFPASADTFMMPGDKPSDASPTSVGWATEDPKTE